MLIEYIRKSRYNPGKKEPRSKKCKYVASREKKGILVALVCADNVVRIGWALCNLSAGDGFTSRGQDIAEERALGHTTTLPHSIKHQFGHFVARAQKYYKDKEVEVNIKRADGETHQFWKELNKINHV